MIPDIELDECIEMVQTFFDNAIRMKNLTADFEYVILAHQYKEILRHLKAYRELIKENNDRDTIQSRYVEIDENEKQIILLKERLEKQEYVTRDLCERIQEVRETLKTRGE